MKQRMTLSLFCLIAALLTSAVSLPGGATAADAKPNIVFILADDLGLGDVSFYNRKILNKEPYVETPNIDALAEQGLWFTDGHSATALCAPTRYAVMSGNNNYRSYAPPGVWSTFAPSAFKKGEVTLGTVVRDAGYQTGFIGKWHMGGDFYIPGTQKIYRGAKSGNLIGKVDVSRWIDGGPKYCGFDYDFTTPCGIQGPMYLAYENQSWYPLGKDSKLIFFNEETAKHPKDVSDKGPGPGGFQLGHAGDGQASLGQGGQLHSGQLAERETVIPVLLQPDGPLAALSDRRVRRTKDQGQHANGPSRHDGRFGHASQTYR